MTPDQRAAQLRKALQYPWGFSLDPYMSGSLAEYRVIEEAARERLAQLEGDALVIPRDRDGNWPLALLDAIREQGETNPWVVQAAIERVLEQLVPLPDRRTE